MIVKFLYNSQHLQLKTDTSRFAINPGVTLFPKNSDDLFTAQFRQPEFWQAIGVINAKRFFDNPCIFSAAHFDQEEQWIEFSESHMELIQLLVFCLWFVKDNSANVLDQFTYPEKGEIFTRRRTMFLSTCEGTYVDTEFTITDFEAAEKWLDRIRSLSTPDDSSSRDSIAKVGVINQGTFASRSYNSNSRVERAIGFLQIARSNSFLPIKISMYVMILECLFSGDETAEITHKIAQRIANYVGNDKADKIKVFGAVKTFYAFRSKYVHGQALKSAQNELLFQREIATQLDSLVRTVLSQILEKDATLFLESGDKMNAYFNAQLF